MEPDPSKAHAATWIARYCCSILKERGGNGRFITTGVRWAESQKRKGNRGIYEALPFDKSKRIILNNDNDDRRLFETCTLKAKRMCNLIVDWTDGEVWDYIESEKLQINSLYQCGFSRVPCIKWGLRGYLVRRQRQPQLPDKTGGSGAMNKKKNGPRRLSWPPSS